MLYLWPTINVVSHLTLFVLTCLSMAAASSKARAHLPWLIPMALAWFFNVCSGVCNLVFLTSIQSAGYSSNSLRWLLIPEGVLSSLGMVCLLGSAVALLVRMQAIPKIPAPPQGTQGVENSWPPPPTA